MVEKQVDFWKLWKPGTNQNIDRRTSHPQTHFLFLLSLALSLSLSLSSLLPASLSLSLKYIFFVLHSFYMATDTLRTSHTIVSATRRLTPSNSQFYNPREEPWLVLDNHTPQPQSTVAREWTMYLTVFRRG